MDDLLARTAPAKHNINGISAATAALGYAKRGIHVVPASRHDKACLLPAGKTPGTGGVHLSSADPEVVRKWFAETYPDAMVGLATGLKSRTIIVDVDGGIKRGKPRRGVESFKEVVKEHGGDFGRPWLVFTTGTPGSSAFVYHLPDWILEKCEREGLRPKSPTNVKVGGRRRPNVDVRANGAYQIVPSSVTDLDRRYVATWVGTREDSYPPQWLLDAILEKVKGEASPDQDGEGEDKGEAVPFDVVKASDLEVRYIERVQDYASTVMRNEVAQLARTPAGGRQSYANRVAYTLGGYAAVEALDEKEAIGQVYAACKTNGLVDDNTELKVRQDIKRAFDAGRAKPRNLAELVEHFVASDAEEGKAVNHLSTIKGLKRVKGGYLCSFYNGALVLQNKPEVAGRLVYEEHADCPSLLAPLPRVPTFDPAPDPDAPPSEAYPVRLEDHHYNRLRLLLQYWGLHNIAADTVKAAVDAVVFSKRINYLRDWLDGLVWDKVERICHHVDPHKREWSPDFPNFWTTYLHIKNSEYSHAAALFFFISAVKRVKEPGCKADYAPVLMGRQGFSKTEILIALFGEKYVGDPIADFKSKDTYLALLGKWCWNLDEFASVKRAEREDVKKATTRREDTYRSPYAEREKSHPRRFVIMATTNEDTPLKDPTGNRRWWPFLLTQRADVEALKRDREQLWAEAVALYKSGQQSWPSERLEAELFTPQQSAAEADDSWIDDVDEYLLHGYCNLKRVFNNSSKDAATIYEEDSSPVYEVKDPENWHPSKFKPGLRDIFIGALERPKGRYGKNEEPHLKDVLTKLGWSRQKDQRTNSVRYYTPSKEWIIDHAYQIMEHLGPTAEKILDDLGYLKDK